MTIRLPWLMALGLILVAGTAIGQTPTWLFRGPQGGTVYCLVADPTHPATLYAGTDEGVYKSDDGGATWRPSNAGLEVYRVQTIAIDPASSSTLYAGTITPNGVESVGIFRSTDAGATWTQNIEGLIDPFTGIAPVDIETIAFDPRHAGTIWAGSRFSEIFESLDNGATWQSKTFGGYSIGLESSSFVFDPSNPSTVLVASTIGLLRTTDLGSTWAQYGNAGVSFFSLAPDPTAPATLYAGSTDGSGFFKSTDGGNHWTATNKGLPGSSGSLPSITAIAVDPSHPTTLYAATYGNGLFQSTDAGANWSSISGSMRSSYVWSVMPLPGQSSTVFASTVGAGVYRSTDSGRTFFASNNGLGLSIINALVPDATSRSIVYAAAFDGIYKTTDAGGSWLPVGTGFPVAPVTGLASRPGNPQTLLASTRGGGVWKSTDGAATWSLSSQGLSDSFIGSITVDPTSSSVLYAGTNHVYTGSNSERVFKSADGGATWSQTSLDAQGFSITSITVNAAKASQVIAVSHGAFGYFQSLDSGNSWSTVNTDVNCGGVNGVFFDPSGSTTYIAGGFGVCRSTDGGKTWTVAAPSALASVETLVIDRSNPSLIYAGAAPAIPGGMGGVFQSTDGGQTWQAIGTGLDAASVAELIVDSPTQTFLAGTHGNGVAQLFAAQNRQSVLRPNASDRRTRTLKSR